jgi:hypothetical protein
MAFATSVTPFSSGPLSDGPNSVSTPGVSASDFMRSTSGFLVSRYGPTLLRAAGTRLDNTVSDFADRIAGQRGSDNGRRGQGNSGGNGSGKGPTPPKGPGSNSGYRPSKRGKIAGIGGSPSVSGVPQFSIDTGIDSGTVVNPLQGTTQYYSPLYVQCGCLFPENNSDSYLADLMGKSLYSYYNNLVLSEVNWGLANQFTEAEFYTYLRKISYALQLYYMIDSILAYTSHSPNTNLAMTNLRMSITPDISNGHIKLREILESTAIPPKLLEFIRYMYQNYSFNNVDGSAIIRLSLNDSLCTGEYKSSLGINSQTYLNIVNDVISCSKTTAVIKKIRPAWVGIMPPSSYEALYDPQFSTFWHNSNIAYEDFGSKVVKYTISVKSNSDLIYYGIFDNRLDGIIYASCSVTDANGVIQKGIWAPFSNFEDKNTLNSSLLYFSKGYQMLPVTEMEFRISSMVYAAPNTNLTKDGNYVWSVVCCSYAGACIPQVHSLENVNQAVSRSVLWLLRP